jgi:hypothetical protein
MNVSLESIENAGDYERERVVLRATRDVDIGDYAVFMARSLGHGVQSGPLEAFWFPDQRVKPGDFIVLYPVHPRSRKSFGEITRKLSVIESHISAHLLGTSSRRKASVVSANSVHVS